MIDLDVTSEVNRYICNLSDLITVGLDLLPSLKVYRGTSALV